MLFLNHEQEWIIRLSYILSLHIPHSKNMGFPCVKQNGIFKKHNQHRKYFEHILQNSILYLTSIIKAYHNFSIVASILVFFSTQDGKLKNTTHLSQ